MMTIADVKKAMRIMKEPIIYYIHKDIIYKQIHKQLVSSLKVYEGRGEYNGTIESAIECLKLAGYEISK